MFWLIFDLIITILFFLVLSIDPKEEKFKVTKKSFLSLFCLLLIGFACFTSIGANRVGIVYNPFKGGIQTYTLGQGYKLKSPLTKVYKINRNKNAV